MPPRHGKSTLVSKYFPAWFTGLWPDKRVLLASYEGNFASSWGLKAKDVQEECGRRVFGTHVRREVASASNWQYKGHDGGMSTAGVGGPFTGKGGDILIVDDPIKNAEEARSPARRELIWDWFNSVAYTRLEPGGAVLVIQTRWNEDDLAGRLIKAEREGGEHYEVISLAAIATEIDDLGRMKGEALCPERFDAEAVAKIKAAIGPYWFAAMYQQNPRPEEGNIFKESWFPRYTGTPQGTFIKRIQILDTAHKTKKENDYSALGTMDLLDGGTYLRHMWREKCTYPDLKRKTQEMFGAWKADELCIEDKDAGAMLIQELQRDTRLPVIAIPADKDKVLRAHAATPACESGRVFLPADGTTPWMEDFLAELLAFPNAAHDDQVDAFVHGINRLKEMGVFLPNPDQVTADSGRRSIAEEYENPL
jgi:predicted phage terminase large subunit-like protein